MNERIKLIRKYFHLSQSEFAEKIKMSRSNLGNIETGAVKVTDRVISDICSAFLVNESWLRTGNGEPFIQPTFEEQAYLRFGNLMENGDVSKKNFISMILTLADELPDDVWNYIYSEFKKCIDMTEKEKSN